MEGDCRIEGRLGALGAVRSELRGQPFKRLDAVSLQFGMIVFVIDPQRFSGVVRPKHSLDRPHGTSSIGGVNDDRGP